MVSSSSSGTATPDGSSTSLLDHPRKAVSSLRLDPREDRLMALAVESIPQDSPNNLRFNSSRKNVSSSFRMPRSRSPCETFRNVSGSLKHEDPWKSPSRTRIYPLESFKLELPEEVIQALNSQKKEEPGCSKKDLSVRSKLEVPAPVRRNSIGSIGPVPAKELMESLMKVQSARCRRESLEVPSSTYRERSTALRRGSISSFATSTPENVRKISLGSCKVHSSQKSPSENQRSPNRSPRKSSSSSPPVDSQRRSPSDNYRSDSGICKLHTPKHSPSEGLQREAKGSLRLGALAKSSSFSFRKERMSSSLRTDPCMKTTEMITRELSRSLRVDPSRRSQPAIAQRESPGGSIKAESMRKSPSRSYKSPSGSFKSLAEYPPERRKSCSGGFMLDAPRRESLGSLHLDSQRKLSAGSAKLDTPRVSPSCSGPRESPGSQMLDTSWCHRKGSSASSTGGSPRQRKKSQYAFPKGEAEALMLASPSNLAAHHPVTIRKGSPGSLSAPRHGSLESLLSATEIEAIMQVSPGSGETDMLGNFRIDSSKEGHLVVTQMKGKTSSQHDSNQSDKLRIVCPLDTKIKIEFKMEQ